MKLPVRTKQYFLGFMLSVIVLFKYPTDPHEYGKDSFIVHEMATHLQNLDHAPWLIHTFSAYALYPFSYAPGMPFILTSLSDISGLSIELVILFFSIIISLVGTCGMFMFASELSNRYEVKFLAGYLFAFTPAISTFTTWTISTRGPFIRLLTVLLWAFSRTINARHKLKIFFLGLVLLFTMPTIHHFSLLFPILILAYLTSYLTVLGLEYTDRISIYYRENVAIASVIILAFMVFLFYLQVSAVDIYSPDLSYFKVWYVYGSQDNPITLAVNILVYYGISMGVLMVYGGVGLANVLGKIEKTRIEWTLLFLILFFTLFLVDKIYLKMFVVPLFIPLAALGIVAIMGRIEHRHATYTTMLSFLLIIAAYYGSYATQQFSDVRTVNDTGYHHYMDEEPYNTAVYTKHFLYEKDGPFAIHNDNVDRKRISAISGLLMLDLEGSNTLVADPDIMENVEVKKYSLSEMYFDTHDTVYYIDWSESNISKSNKFSEIIARSWGNPELAGILEDSRVSWAFVYTYFPDEHGTASHPFQNQGSRFFRSLPESRYCLYENQYDRIYFLLPA